MNRSEHAGKNRSEPAFQTICNQKEKKEKRKKYEKNQNTTGKTTFETKKGNKTARQK